MARPELPRAASRPARVKHPPVIRGVRTSLEQGVCIKRLVEAESDLDAVFLLKNRPDRVSAESLHEGQRARGEARRPAARTTSMNYRAVQV
jgi:hypothetical protein